MFFKRTVAELLAEPDDVATTPPVAPPTHRFGIPDGAISLAVDALQQTVAVGARSGEVMLFAGGAQMLLPPPVESPVRHLAFATNSGRLLSIHAPGTACIWDLRDSVRLEARSKLTEPSGTDAVVSIAKMIPGSSLALLGTAEGTALAYDVVEGKAAPWSLGCGDGPLCALEANPLEPRRVLAGQKRGALQVFELGVGGFNAKGLDGITHGGSPRLSNGSYIHRDPERSLIFPTFLPSLAPAGTRKECATCREFPIRANREAST